MGRWPYKFQSPKGQSALDADKKRREAEHVQQMETYYREEYEKDPYSPAIDVKHTAKGILAKVHVAKCVSATGEAIVKCDDVKEVNDGFAIKPLLNNGLVYMKVKSHDGSEGFEHWTPSIFKKNVYEATQEFINEKRSKEAEAALLSEYDFDGAEEISTDIEMV